jgi:alpha-amylase
MKRGVVLYLHVHQPFRIKHYTIFDAASDHEYFTGQAIDDPTNNCTLINKVAKKSYLPTNRTLLKLLERYPDFRLSLSITGTVLEQMERWAPEALQSFKDLVNTGRVEILAETFHHTLAFFYSRPEFEMQVNMHRQKVESLFGKAPQVFRNSELAYNNDLAYWADQAGYKGILAEGWDKILGWRNSNFVYRPAYTNNIRLLLKNYKLSDDIAFRFGDHNWPGWPLTADKFVHWMNETHDANIFNIFMDYETFGEHQWQESGIFNFLEHFPKEWLKQENNTFYTVSEAIDTYEAVDTLDVPETVTWADTERDLSAWLGNSMQQEAARAIYDLESKIIGSGDLALIEDWRKLQASDNFYYMCTKWFNDGDIHAYFSPYETPYVAAINFMNVWHDLCYRLSEKGIEV